MALKDSLQELQQLDLGELDFENIGSWPSAVKVIAWILVLVLILGLGYYLSIADLKANLAREEAKEKELKEEFKQKAFKAANLEALREQMKEMEESFGALVSQLPSDTEVPGLLEDITKLGEESGLEIDSITLQSEQAREFYVELPIKISVRGGYHELATFVSGISSLPRIVTLHNFKITEGKDGRLSMAIDAKTYRYKDV